MFKKILGLLASVLIVLTGLAWLAYRSDIGRAYERVRGKSQVIPSPYGAIEYLEGGSGPDILIVHASGGGFDQGELLAQTMLGDQFHWVAPSRFGYLRSTFHVGATWDDQAHAYAYLLDHLGIQKVAVVAMSAGGPSALLFALLYPERVSSLTLLSCGTAPVKAVEQAQADQKGKMLVTLFQHDWLYWLFTKLFNKPFMALMGATDEVIAGLSDDQRQMVEHTIDYMNPVSLRSAGVVFDNTHSVQGERYAGIKAPTLIVHAQDDTLQLYENATFATATIPGARLMSYERGGHLVVFIEQAPIQMAVQTHIFDNIPEQVANDE